MKQIVGIVCLVSTLGLGGCSSSQPFRFGETFCDCVKKAHGDRTLYQQCADSVIQSSVEYQQVLKNANREEFMKWRKSIVQGMVECKEELRDMGIIIDTTHAR